VEELALRLEELKRLIEEQQARLRSRTKSSRRNPLISTRGPRRSKR